MPDSSPSLTGLVRSIFPSGSRHIAEMFTVRACLLGNPRSRRVRGGMVRFSSSVSADGVSNEPHSTSRNSLSHRALFPAIESTRRTRPDRPSSLSPDHPAPSATPSPFFPSWGLPARAAENGSDPCLRPQLGCPLPAYRGPADSLRFPLQRESDRDLPNSYSGRWRCGFHEGPGATQSLAREL